MALTLVDQNASIARRPGNVMTKIVKVTFDSSYDAGGESLTPADVGLNTILFAVVHPVGGYVFEYDYANKKIIAYRQKDPANAGGADIALPEVTAGVSLSSVVTRALIVGY